MDDDSPGGGAQGPNDLKVPYDHALARLITAGSELDRVGTELSFVQRNFHVAINDFFDQLQLQIDDKNMTIRLMSEQNIGMRNVYRSTRDALFRAQDENILLKTENDQLKDLIQANYSGTLCTSPVWPSSSIPSGTAPATSPHVDLHC